MSVVQKSICGATLEPQWSVVRRPCTDGRLGRRDADGAHQFGVGVRHPDALGAPLFQVWPELESALTPRIAAIQGVALGGGMAMALDKVEAQKDVYDANGISSTRPWIIYTDPLFSSTTLTESG